ncbi:DUF523 domain-containing protein [Terasakiella sp. SH-1]|uniref:DUF523 domain-containing protein n=1 Tax=Terasakiella sp. SH-1 TaxID=2560057 RepID=UPI001073D756|nr:DUF523 domain-containing protein [Terasakiella sp. SH-1]
MEKILISACLYGEVVRYDGRQKRLNHPYIQRWQEEGRLVAICPEVAGGLPVPRSPCEYDMQTGHVLTKEGQDFTAAFQAGAQAVLHLAQTHHIRFALLKERSPSCGSNEIYDGHFSGRTIKGQGISAALLQENGIQVYSEETLEALNTDLKAAE